MISGLLLIDKPSGPTSHDVVARVRRTLGERRIGHTGTLDPLASGLLPLVVGHATRLAAWLSGEDKTYEAVIQLGVATDTDDSEGQPLGPATAVLPDDRTLEAAVDAFRGGFDQVPPAHSAKRVGGTRAYRLARQARPVELSPVRVEVRALELTDRRHDLVSLRVTVSTGFYVRALARDLGRRLGCGGHLTALRRTRCGTLDVESAIPLAEAERAGTDLASRLVPPAGALPALPAVEVTEAGLKRAAHGNWLGLEHLSGAVPQLSVDGAVRVLSDGGDLVAIARFRAGLLHPVVVLG